MSFKKETFIFLTSLALILIIGYINLVMSTQETFEEPSLDEAALEQRQDEFASLESDDDSSLSFMDSTDITDIADITDKTDITPASSSASNETINVSFENFKISKEKNNMGIVDQIESSLSSETISEDTKKRFEDLLVTKNTQIQMENNIEIMLQSKGYKDFVCVVNGSDVKVITNQDIEKADATKILDIVINETKYDAQQIKIVKFNNKEL